MAQPLLYPYQRDWFLDKARFKLGRFARQTGKTFTSTLEIVDDVYQAESQGLRSQNRVMNPITWPLLSTRFFTSSASS